MKKYLYIFLCAIVFLSLTGVLGINSKQEGTEDIPNDQSVTKEENIPKEQKAEDDLSEIHIEIDGEIIQLAIAPIIINEHYMVPGQTVIEHIGAEFSWDDDKKQVKINRNDVELIFTLNSTIVGVNGMNEKIDVAPVMASDTVMLPIKFISEKLGIEMHMDDQTETIILEKPSELLIPYTKALDMFKEGVTAFVTDIDTGITYTVKRIGGQGFADVEPLTAEDTQKLLDTYEGEWSWKRRAIIVTIDGVDIAASMAGMPHSGRDDAPFGAIVDNRSGGTGRGINLNSIRDNNMNGVVDIYFYNSLIPGLNRVDERHQHMVMKAAKSQKQ